LALSYGIRTVDRSIFPCALLFLIVPLPESLLASVVRSLQAGTADIAEVLFQFAGVPFARSGFDFELPGVIIEIAEECSGIRSSMALVVTNLVAAHLFLRSVWAKTILAGITIPLIVLKNAIRVVTVAWLGIRVDPAFLTGNLHRRGGVVFFAVALVFVATLLTLLQRLERTRDASIHP
jgi:exosortase